MHATEEVNVDLQEIITRLKNTLEHHRLNSSTELDQDFSWGAAALEKLIGKVDHLNKECPQPDRESVSYINVIAEKRTEPMWSVATAEVLDVGEFQFYVSATGCIVYWFIDASSAVNEARQLDFTLKSLRRLSEEELARFRSVARYLINTVT